MLAGGIAIVRRIRKRTVKYWWLIPCVMVYSIAAVCNTFIAGIAYDDPADPNYGIYKGWALRDFILNDLKVLVIGLFLAALLCLVLRRKKAETTSRRAVRIVLAVLSAGAVVFILFAITFSAGKRKEGEIILPQQEKEGRRLWWRALRLPFLQMLDSAEG